MSIFLSTLQKVHDSDNSEHFRKLNPHLEPAKQHESWIECRCLAAADIRKRMEQMDEDDPSKVLTPEEHILLFNKCKIKDANTSIEELIATRHLMKRAVALIRTHVQAKTVLLNEHRSRASKKEKEAIIAADKQYSPRLRPDEKASEAEIKMMNEINENPRIKAFLKALPTPAYKSVLNLIKQLGLDETIKIMKWDVLPAPESE